MKMITEPLLMPKSASLFPGCNTVGFFSSAARGSVNLCLEGYRAFFLACSALLSSSTVACTLYCQTLFECTQRRGPEYLGGLSTTRSFFIYCKKAEGLVPPKTDLKRCNCRKYSLHTADARKI